MPEPSPSAQDAKHKLLRALKEVVTWENVATQFIQMTSVGVGVSTGGIPGAFIGIFVGLLGSSIFVASTASWNGAGRKEEKKEDGIELDILPGEDEIKHGGDKSAAKIGSSTKMAPSVSE